MKKLLKILSSPFSLIKDGFKWLIYDTWDDLKFLKKAWVKGGKGEQVLNPEKVEAFKKEIKTLTIRSIIKDNWYWFLVAGFCICVGYLWGLKICSDQCNMFIYEDYIKDSLQYNLSLLIPP